MDGDDRLDLGLGLCGLSLCDARAGEERGQEGEEQPNTWRKQEEGCLQKRSVCTKANIT